VAEEGLAERFRRHRVNSAALQAGLEAMGLTLLVEEAVRLPTLVAVKVPPGVDDARMRQDLLADYGIEIGGGLGQFKGRIVRIGVMGHSAQPKNVLLLLAALEDCLDRQGFGVPFGEAERAALSAYREAAVESAE